MSVGGSKSKQSGNQSSESRSFGSGVWGTQSPFLQDLYQRAQVFADNQVGYEGGMASLNRSVDQLNSAANWYGNSNAALQSFMRPEVDPAVNAYATNLGQQFSEQFLPGLKGEAALAGGLGGSRQQIGSALGAQRAMQTLGDFAAQSYAGQQERKLAASQALASNAAGLAGIADQQLAAGDFARSMPWHMLNQYAGLLGSPVQLDLGGYNKSKGKSSGGSAGFNFGFGSG